MNSLKYEGISIVIEDRINEKIKRENKYKHMKTDKERQYSFLVFLQSLPITKKQVFDIYTNTDIT